MAEVVGLVASVVQLAGAGLKLSQTLYQYADGVASADRRIKDIANEVKLTSFVIQELGAIFERDETANLISENAVRTANETIKECFAVFTELELKINKGKPGKMGRLMLPFKDNKIELLRSQIDKLKSTLELLMQVLIHAHQVSSEKYNREAEAKHREEIKQLLENKKQATKKYEESLRNFSISDGSTIVDDGDRSLQDKDDIGSSSDLFNTAGAIGSTINPDTLATCVEHVRSLLADIETLQLALTAKVDGDDHSDHHQKAIGSYFLARSHLDSVLLGNAQAKVTDTSSQLSISKTSTQASVSATLDETLKDEDVGSSPSNERAQTEFENQRARDNRVSGALGHRFGRSVTYREATRRREESSAMNQQSPLGRPPSYCYAPPGSISPLPPIKTGAPSYPPQQTPIGYTERVKATSGHDSRPDALSQPSQSARDRSSSSSPGYLSEEIGVNSHASTVRFDRAKRPLGKDKNETEQTESSTTHVINAQVASESYRPSSSKKRAPPPLSFPTNFNQDYAPPPSARRPSLSRDNPFAASPDPWDLRNVEVAFPINQAEEEAKEEARAERRERQVEQARKRIKEVKKRMRDEVREERREEEQKRQEEEERKESNTGSTSTRGSGKVPHWQRASSEASRTRKSIDRNEDIQESAGLRGRIGAANASSVRLERAKRPPGTDNDETEHSGSLAVMASCDDSSETNEPNQRERAIARAQMSRRRKNHRERKEREEQEKAHKEYIEKLERPELADQSPTHAGEPALTEEVPADTRDSPFYSKDGRVKQEIALLLAKEDQRFGLNTYCTLEIDPPEDDQVNQQMALLLTKGDSPAGPDSNCTFRIDLPEDRDACDFEPSSSKMSMKKKGNKIEKTKPRVSASRRARLEGLTGAATSDHGRSCSHSPIRARIDTAPPVSLHSDHHYRLPILVPCGDRSEKQEEMSKDHAPSERQRQESSEEYSYASSQEGTLGYDDNDGWNYIDETEEAGRVDEVDDLLREWTTLLG